MTLSYKKKGVWEKALHIMPVPTRMRKLEIGSHQAFTIRKQIPYRYENKNDVKHLDESVHLIHIIEPCHIIYRLP